jgi:uncharacterized protein YchJ
VGDSKFVVERSSELTSRGAAEPQRYVSAISYGYNRNIGMRNKKIGRNEPCSCGSGKKYKKCCYGKTLFNTNQELPNINQSFPAYL